MAAQERREGSQCGPYQMGFVGRQREGGLEGRRVRLASPLPLGRPPCCEARVVTGRGAAGMTEEARRCVAVLAHWSSATEKESSGWPHSQHTDSRFQAGDPGTVGQGSHSTETAVLVQWGQGCRRGCGPDSSNNSLLKTCQPALETVSFIRALATPAS